MPAASGKRGKASTDTVEKLTVKASEFSGSVYCPLCTHTVTAMVAPGKRGLQVVPGQHCPRCSSSLDAGYVIRVDRAA